MVLKTQRARDAHQERAVAQAECIKFLNSVGYAKKERDGIRCQNCGFTVIEHTAAGIADYSGCVKNRKGLPHAYVVEVKAGGLVFSMNRIQAEQWSWLNAWEQATGGIAWFWLMMGTEPVNKPDSADRRQVYLVPASEMLTVQGLLLKASDGKNSCLPFHSGVPRILKAFKEHSLTADHLFSNLSHRQLFWCGSNVGWRPGADHLWTQLYGNPLDGGAE